MIKCDSDRTIICADCRRPAISRHREVRHANIGARYIDFDSHYEETDPQFVEMMNRVDSFHERVHALQAVVKKVCLAFHNLSTTFLDAEIETVKPTACAVRTMIIPTALITAYGKQSELRLPARELDSATVDEIVADLLIAAENEVVNLRARFERGAA